MRFAVFFLTLLLAGCQTPLEALHSADPQASDFASALAAEYMAYADSEVEQGHQAVGQYFAAKGLKALSGEPVDPETPDTALPQPVQDKLITARGALVAVLTEDIKRVSAQKAARAQLLFDCWHQQESRFASEKITQELAPCADEFQATLSDLQIIAESFVQGREAGHIINFDKNSAELDEDDDSILRIVAEDVACITDYKIELHGRSGSRKNAQALSNKRMSAIRDALAAKGVPARHIKIKKVNSSKVVYLSSDAVKATNQVEIKVRTFGQDGRK